MKKVITLLAFIFLSINLSAQETPQLALSSIVSNDNTIPQSSANMLLNKMKAIVTQNGLIDEGEQRYVLTANIDILEKGYNSAGMLIQKMAITFFVGDILENKIYASTTINTMGIGQSDIKAYNMAFQRISPTSPEIKQLLNDISNKVINYYITNYPDIETEVDRLVEMGQYDQAITKLITIPSICSDVYDKAQAKCVTIYHQKRAALTSEQKAKTDKEGLVLLQQAKAAWSSKQDYESASNALSILSQIDPESECFDQANMFIQSINDKLRTDERNKAAAEAAIAQRNWEFKMRQYEDNLAMKKQKEANNAAILGTLAERFGKFDINYQKTVTTKWGR